METFKKAHVKKDLFLDFFHGPVRSKLSTVIRYSHVIACVFLAGGLFTR